MNQHVEGILDHRDAYNIARSGSGTTRLVTEIILIWASPRNKQ